MYSGIGEIQMVHESHVTREIISSKAYLVLYLYSPSRAWMPLHQYLDTALSNERETKGERLIKIVLNKLQYRWANINVKLQTQP